MQATGHANSRDRDNKPPAVNAADVLGSLAAGSGISGERSTPSSSPNSTSNPLLQYTSSSRLDSPAGEAAAGQDASPDSQQFRHGSVPRHQQELQQRFQQDGSTPQHSQIPTAKGAACAGKPQYRDESAHGARQHLQESSGSRLAVSSHQQQQEGAAGSDQTGQEEEDGADDAGQVGLELLGAVAAAADDPAAHYMPAQMDAAEAAAMGGYRGHTVDHAAASASIDMLHPTTTAHKSRGHRAAAAGAAAAAAAAAVLAAEDGDDDNMSMGSMGGNSSRGAYGSNKSSHGGARGGSKGTAAVSAGGLPLVCQVPDCGVPLTGAHVSPYFRRHRVCVAHAKADSVTMYGRNHRFCQQCGVLHPLEDFDGQRKSCRVQLDKHNLRRQGIANGSKLISRRTHQTSAAKATTARRCRRKSQTKLTADPLGPPNMPHGAPMDPYGSIGMAQTYCAMPWNPAMQSAAGAAGAGAALEGHQTGKRGSSMWGPGVSEDTGGVSRDDAPIWPGDAAESGPHQGYPWGVAHAAAGFVNPSAAIYANHMMQQQYHQGLQNSAAAAAGMQSGGGSEAWGMGPGLMDPAAAAAAGWGPEGWMGSTAPGSVSPGNYGSGAVDTSYAAALAAATAAANGFKASAGSKGASNPQGGGSNVQGNKRSSSGNAHAAVAAAAAAAGLPEQFVASLTQQLDAAAVRMETSRQQQQQHAHSRAAAASAAAAAAAVPEAQQTVPGSGGGVYGDSGRAPARGSKSGSSGGGGQVMGLQQLRLYIAAAIAAGKGPGLSRLRDLGFVQQLLIVDELAHGVLAEMQQDSNQQGQQAETAAAAAGAAGATVPPVSVGGHHGGSNRHAAYGSEHDQDPSPRHNQQQQQQQQRPRPSPQQQQQQRATATSHAYDLQPEPAPPKQEQHGVPAAAAAPAGGPCAGSQPNPPAASDVQNAQSSIPPPAALAALMEQIVKYASNPAVAAAASAAVVSQQQQPAGAPHAQEQQHQQQPAAVVSASDPAAAAVGGTALPRHGANSSSSSKPESGVKREPQPLNMVPVHKRTKLGQGGSSQPQGGSSSTTPGQGLRRPVSAPAAAAATAAGSNVSRPANRADGSRPNGPSRPAAQQQQAGGATLAQQQLQQQLQGLVQGAQSGNNAQATQALQQLLNQLSACTGGAANNSATSC